MGLSGPLGGVFHDYRALHVPGCGLSRMGWAGWATSHRGSWLFETYRPCRRAWSRPLGCGGRRPRILPWIGRPRLCGASSSVG